MRRDFRAAAERFLAKQNLGVADIDHFICHPGGTKVLAALEASFEMKNGALDIARGVLRDCGNMSAATAMFVLDRSLKAGVSGPMLMTALGPGFTAAFLLLDPA